MIRGAPLDEATPRVPPQTDVVVIVLISVRKISDEQHRFGSALKVVLERRERVVRLSQISCERFKFKVPNRLEISIQELCHCKISDCLITQITSKSNIEKHNKKNSPMIPNLYGASMSMAGGVLNQNSRAESPLPIL